MEEIVIEIKLLKKAKHKHLTSNITNAGRVLIQK